MRCLGHDTGRRSILKSRRFSLTRILTGAKVIKTHNRKRGEKIMGGWKTEIRTLASDFGLNMVMVNNLIYETEKK